MTTFRVVKDRQNPYVMLNKGFLENPDLSAKAKGILAYMLSRPDNWIFYLGQLAQVFRDGRDSLRSGIRELIDHGYFRRCLVRNKRGEVTGIETQVYEYPREIPEHEILPPQGFYPESDFPISGNPATEDPTVINNEFQSIKEINNYSPLTPLKISEAVEKTRGREDENFEAQEPKPTSQSKRTGLKAVTGFLAKKAKATLKDKNSAAAPPPVENPNVQIAVDGWLKNEVFIHWWANSVARTPFGANELVLTPLAFVNQMICKYPKVAEKQYYAFQVEMSRRVSVYNQRVLGGISISPAEHEEIATIAPYSDVPIAKPTQAFAPGAVQVLAPGENAPKADQALKSAAPLATPPKPATNGSAYEVKASHTTAQDLIPSKPPEWLAEQLKQLINKSGMPRVDKQQNAAQPTDPLEKYKAWMQDPILRREAIKWAVKRNDLVLMRDGNGEIYDFEWIDF